MVSSRYANQEMLAEIAREYGRGRLLLIGTTNLDAGRQVIWNMGAIAASGQPRALDLFRRLLLASAAIPAIFPPVLIDVELNGGHYQELHVDGGAVAQMFLYPPGLTQVQAVRGIQSRPLRAWLIRNSRLDPEWASVRRQTGGPPGQLDDPGPHGSRHGRRNGPRLRRQACDRGDAA